MDKIDSFTGNYRWLSNFWPCDVVYEGITYPTTEHAYHAAKTLDEGQRHEMAAQETPGDAKRFGRKITLRPDWEQVKVGVMRDLIAQKFSSTSGLGRMLHATGDAELIEGNTWGDTIWGICDGVGENLLGKLLMERREINNVY